MYTRIKQVLDYTGLNQQEFAEKIAVAPATLSNILKGKVAKYNTDLVMSIRMAFPEIDFEWLLTGDGQMLKSTAPVNNSQDDNVSLRSNLSNEDLAAGVDGSPLSGVVPDSYASHASVEIRPTNDAYQSTSVNPNIGKYNPRATAGGATRRGGNIQTSLQPMGGYPPGYPSQDLHNMAMKIIDRNFRSIKEIRVYFDDDTFEVFVPSKQ